MIYGFTGTRHGMTTAQRRVFTDYLRTHMGRADSLLHGDCTGADQQAHHIVKAIRPHSYIEIYPSNLSDNRAYCEGAALVHSPQPPLVRNKLIVDGCGLLLSTPAEPYEMHRGGTWHTVRYARSRVKAHIIFWPDGSVLKSWEPNE